MHADCLPHQVRAIGLEWEPLRLKALDTAPLEWEPLRLKALDTAPDAADGALLFRFWTSDRTVIATDCD